jgi:hypothetical protein
MNETPDHAPPRPIMKQYYTELGAATIINAMSAHPCSLHYVHIGVVGVEWELLMIDARSTEICIVLRCQVSGAFVEKIFQIQ